MNLVFVSVDGYIVVKWYNGLLSNYEEKMVARNFDVYPNTWSSKKLQYLMKKYKNKFKGR